MKTLCKTCKNNFITEIPLYVYREGELHKRMPHAYVATENLSPKPEPTEKQIEECGLILDEYCIYTRLLRNAIKCTFYNRKPNPTELRKEDGIKADDDDCSSHGYQDIDRTFTTGERQLSVRLDCKPVQREAA